MHPQRLNPRSFCSRCGPTKSRALTLSFAGNQSVSILTFSRQIWFVRTWRPARQPLWRAALRNSLIADWLLVARGRGSLLPALLMAVVAQDQRVHMPLRVA